MTDKTQRVKEIVQEHNTPDGLLEDVLNGEDLNLPALIAFKHKPPILLANPYDILDQLELVDELIHLLQISSASEAHLKALTNQSTKT